MIISDCSFKLDPQQTRKARQSRKAISKSRKAITKNRKEAVLDFSAQPLFIVVMRLSVSVCQPLFVLCMIVSCMMLHA